MVELFEPGMDLFPTLSFSFCILWPSFESFGGQDIASEKVELMVGSTRGAELQTRVSKRCKISKNDPWRR